MVSFLPMSIGPIAGWVLTGGASTRMGEDKALLEIDGIPLVMRVAGVVAEVAFPVTLVGAPGRYVHLGLPVVGDSVAGFGPVAGLHAALAATAVDWNVVVACDMPDLEVSLLRLLLERAGDATCDCVIPYLPGGHAEPLCALYHRRCLEVVETALARGIHKVTRALEGLRIERYETDGAEPFQNLNTPGDLHSYYRRG